MPGARPTLDDEDAESGDSYSVPEPCHIPDSMRDRGAYLIWFIQRGFPRDDDSEPQLPPDVQVAVDFCHSRSPSEVVKVRVSAMAHWTRRREQLTEEWLSLRRTLPEHVQIVLPPSANLLVFRELLQAAGHGDHQLIADIMRGFPQVGLLPPPNTGQTPAPTQPRVGREEFLTIAKVRNAELLRRARPTGPVEAGWEKTKAEEAEGKAILWRLDSIPFKDFVLSRRHTIQQGEKVRVVDDYSGSFFNCAAAPAEHLHLDHIDGLAALAIMPYRATGRGAQELKRLPRMSGDDTKGALKTNANAGEGIPFLLLITFSPESTEPVIVCPLANPFGAVGSLHAWHRIGAALCAILNKVFVVPTLRYIDDLFRAGVDDLAHSGKLVSWVAVHQIVGWPFDPKKSVPNPAEPAAGASPELPECPQKMRSLGCDVEIAGHGVRVTLPADKREKWIACIDEALASDVLDGTAAGKLAGRLAFASQRIFSRVGRAMIRPLYFRQTHGGRRKTRRLELALGWWRQLLNGPCTRLVPWTPDTRPPIIINSDAEGSGGLAAVLVDCHSGRREFFSFVLPNDIYGSFLPRKNHIAAMELVAVLVAVSTWLPTLHGRRVVIYTDNTWAQATLVSGWAGQADMNALAAAFWLLCGRCDVEAWVDWVPSHVNPADPPSRGDCDWCLARRFRRVSPQIPELLETMVAGGWKSLIEN